MVLWETWEVTVQFLMMLLSKNKTHMPTRWSSVKSKVPKFSDLCVFLFVIVFLFFYNFIYLFILAVLSLHCHMQAP